MKHYATEIEFFGDNDELLLKAERSGRFWSFNCSDSFIKPEELRDIADVIEDNMEEED